jgi:predicted aconitase with swiveling domain
MARVIKCKCRVSGKREGELLTTDQPISFWGGVDSQKGFIIDPRHELFGASVAGKVLAFPYGKGSAAAPMVILELVRAKNAPAALVQIEVDPLLVSGPIICKYFYNETIPVVTLNNEEFQLLKTGLHAVIDGNRGEIILSTRKNSKIIKGNARWQ